MLEWSLLGCVAVLLAGVGIVLWGLAAPVPVVRMSLRVIAREDCGDVMLLTLARPWRQRLPAARPGQYLVLEAAPDPARPVLRRSYSLARWQPHARHYQLAIKRQPGGKMSSWLAERLQRGSRLQVRPPAGQFVLAPDDSHVVLIAGGVGITPLLAMLDALRQRTTPPARVLLLYAARQRQQLLWHDELQQLAASLPWFDYRPCLSRPDSQWQGWHGRLDAARLADAVQGWPQASIYQCAGPGLMATMSEAALALALPGGVRLRQEHFGVAADGDGSWHQVRVGERQLAVQSGRPLLAELEQDVLFPDAGCRAGECGGCCLPLQAGEVTWLQTPLQAPPAGHILACCCSARSDLVLGTPR